MLAPLECSTEERGELETRDCSDSLQTATENVVRSPRSLTVSRTEDAILDVNDGASISSNKSVEMLTLTDDDSDFNQDLPTEYKPPVEANAQKDLIVVVTK